MSTERATPAPEAVKVPLSRPLGNRTELDLRRPTAAELRPLPLRILQKTKGRKTDATWGDMISIVAGCSGTTVEELGDLKPIDAMAAIVAVGAFLPDDLAPLQAARVRQLPDGGATITLGRPVVLGSETLSVLNVRAPVTRDLLEIPLEPGLGELLDLASTLTVQPGAFLDRLDVEDAFLLIQLTAVFFADSRATGDKP